MNIQTMAHTLLVHSWVVAKAARFLEIPSPHLCQSVSEKKAEDQGGEEGEETRNPFKFQFYAVAERETAVSSSLSLSLCVCLLPPYMYTHSGCCFCGETETNNGNPNVVGGGGKQVFSTMAPVH